MELPVTGETPTFNRKDFARVLGSKRLQHVEVEKLLYIAVQIVWVGQHRRVVEAYDEEATVPIA